LDNYPAIRLKASDTVVRILKLPQVDGGSFDKPAWFSEVIAPSLEGSLESPRDFPQDAYTALALLVRISSEVPELSVKCLIMILDTFSRVGLDIYPRHCQMILCSGLSERVHFSVLLRQFLPIVAPHICSFLDSPLFPFQLFYYDEPEMSLARASKELCTQLNPYLLGTLLVEDPQALIGLFSKVCGLSAETLIQQNAPHVAAFYLISYHLATDQTRRAELQQEYERVRGDFESPLPFLAFVGIANDDAIAEAYRSALKEDRLRNFTDVRGILFELYREIYRSNHAVVLSYYLHQFVFCATIACDTHRAILEDNTTIFVDLLARAVSLIKFAPIGEITSLLLLLSQHIPVSV
jgi:hypothetical protein